MRIRYPALDNAFLDWACFNLSREEKHHFHLARIVLFLHNSSFGSPRDASSLVTLAMGAGRRKTGVASSSAKAQLDSSNVEQDLVGGKE